MDQDIKVDKIEQKNALLNPEANSNKDNEIEMKKQNKKRHFKMLSAFSMLLLIIVVLIFISWILKWTGATTTVQDADGNETSQAVQAMGIFDLFIAPMKGFGSRWAIIVFILSLGAFINILICSKSLEGFSQMITFKLKGKEIWAIIPLMTFFSFCGTTEGMAEESLGFYMICIPLMMAAGFDKITGLFIVLIGAGTGTLASTVNPFAIGIAVDSLNQAQSGLTSVGDGLVWRIISWAAFTSTAITFVIMYARKVKLNPQKSIVFATLKEDKKYFLSESVEKIEMNWRRKLTLVVFLITFIVMIAYLVGWDSILGYTDADGDFGPMMKFQNWVFENVPYLTGAADGFGLGGLEIVGGIFLIGSIFLGIVNGLGEEGFLKEFMTGAADILSVCLIIATAAGIGWILDESHMKELFVNGLANSIGGINSPILTILVLYIIFLPLSFVIPSTSGFAAAIFPLLGGVASKHPDVIPSGSITAFSFSSGLLNLITPTSGVVMGSIAIARLDYAKFLKVIAPFIGIVAILSMVLLAIGGAIGGTIA